MAEWFGRWTCNPEVRITINTEVLDTQSDFIFL